MLRCIAIDDEPLALNVVEIFCNKTESLNLCKSFTSGLEALAYLKENEIDLVFLDINMPQLTGVELAKIIDKSTMIIFTTAYQHYAVEGFELQAVDYILKPFSYDRFKKAVDRAEMLYQLQTSNSVVSADSEEQSFMMIRSDYATVRVDISSIICVEGLKDYVKIYTDDKNYVTKITMKAIEKHLLNYGFMRIHKSYIVNLSKIKSFEYNHINMPKDIKVSVGNVYRAAFVDYVQKNKL